MDFKEMQKILMDELRLMHYPIAVKFIFIDIRYWKILQFHKIYAKSSYTNKI